MENNKIVAIIKTNDFFRVREELDAFTYDESVKTYYGNKTIVREKHVQEIQILNNSNSNTFRKRVKKNIDIVLGRISMNSDANLRESKEFKFLQKYGINPEITYLEVIDSDGYPYRVVDTNKFEIELNNKLKLIDKFSIGKLVSFIANSPASFLK